MNLVHISRALISVYDKTKILPFAHALAEMGVKILSSGGTAKVLHEAGLEVQDVQEWTGFPPMLGHRVVTLHPKVHGGILALRDDPAHQQDMKLHGIEPIDLVCVGLYPFSQAIAKPSATLEDAVEMIDIGGPAMVRAAAKNHAYVTIVTDSCQYDRVIQQMWANDGAVSFALRQELALEAFSLTGKYDSAISAYLAEQTGRKFPDTLNLSYTKVSSLRYGENPHQQAAFYVSEDSIEPCVGRSELLGGKEVSYNNYFDANGALELVKEFDKPAVAIIKHANPVGCAVDDDLVEAYRKAYFGDVNAAMGGIIAVNRPVTKALTSAIVDSYRRWGKSAGAGGFFAEIIIAPAFDEDALEVIRAKEGWGQEVRLLRTGPLTGRRNREKYLKYIVGGLLVQDRDLVGINQDNWKTVSRRRPGEREIQDMKFAWLVCKHVKSNAIVIAKNQALLGAGAGQMSRVNSVRLATTLAEGYGGGKAVDTKGCVLASDAFFPFADSLDWAVQAGASAVIEPGGAKKDQEIIARADELGLAMIFTGTRHFNH